MLYIVFKHGIERQWHVGEELITTTDYINDVVEIQADGDELEHIKSQYTQYIGGSPHSSRSLLIPVPSGKRVVRWFGDIARTIVANL